MLNWEISQVKARFRFNLKPSPGVPAISVPSGYNEKGLPTGLMLHSKWYDEEKLLKVAYQMDHKVNRLRPKVYYEM